MDSLKDFVDQTLKHANRMEDFRKFRPLVKKLCDLLIARTENYEERIKNLQEQRDGKQALISEDEIIIEGMRKTIVERDKEIEILKSKSSTKKAKKKVKKSAKKK